ncbi:MAG: TlpA disulfide reductase family protein [Pseudobdellovibrio sp.]
MLENNLLKRKNIFNKISNILIISLVLFVGYRKIPEMFSRFKEQGLPSARIQVETLAGAVFDSENMHSPFVVVFWATWCAPCQIELSRLNTMILNKEIQPNSVLAISLQEERSHVQEVAKERDYKFQIGIDSSGQIANDFKVEGTPTLILIDADKTIHWITTGLSPKLEYRVGHFLKN